jgi:hypothetical protein
MAVIKTTTITDTGKPAISHLPLPAACRRCFLVFLAALLGSTLLTLSFPRLRASLAFLPAETALRNNQQIRPITRDRFPGLIQAANNSIRIHDDSRYQHGLAWLHYLDAALSGYGTNEAKASLVQAQQAFEARLQSSPAEPADWLRLGWVHLLLNHPASQIIDAWKMSVYSGRAEHYLLSDRLELGFRLADSFGEDDLSLLRDQTLLTWKYRKQDMRKKIQQQSFQLTTFQNLLSRQDPETLAEIEKEYDKLR